MNTAPPADYLERILRARVYDVAVETPLEPAANLSKRLGNHVLFKREDLQSVFSFKLRGAYNKLASMTAAELRGGVVCASAGNHAQGVALAARELSVPATVYMPVSTPLIKTRAVAALGADIVLEGDDYDAACAAALAFAAERSLPFIHPFDDPDVIAGQGTIGMEILQQGGSEIDAVFVPIGGGGLMAGVSAYVKSVNPDIRVIGVEPEDAASMHAAFAAGGPVTLEQVGIFADGVAVKRVGDETYRLCRQYVDDILLVSNDEICAAIQDIFEDTRTIVEPAGALAVAGIKRYVAASGSRGETLVSINCGANINFDRLRHIAERAALGEQREALFAVDIPEVKGSFLAFCEALGARNVTEFNYRFHDAQTAHIFVGVELRKGMEERQRIAKLLADAGYSALDITDNELAKLHVRYMVGGQPHGLEDERLFRFRFPERPGALLEFLQSIGSRWNISLFHYRNHGADYGRVLAGVQLPAADEAEFNEHIAALGYAWRDETDNPAYQRFLT